MIIRGGSHRGLTLEGGHNLFWPLLMFPALCFPSMNSRAKKPPLHHPPAIMRFHSNTQNQASLNPKKFVLPSVVPLLCLTPVMQKQANRHQNKDGDVIRMTFALRVPAFPIRGLTQSCTSHMRFNKGCDSLHALTGTCAWLGVYVCLWT